MPCSSCSADTLRIFLNALVAPNARRLCSFPALPKHRRAFHSRASLGLQTSASTFGEPPEAIATSSSSLDNNCLPFEAPDVFESAHPHDKPRSPHQQPIHGGSADSIPRSDHREGSLLYINPISDARGELSGPQIEHFHLDQEHSAPFEGHFASEMLKALPPSKFPRTGSKSEQPSGQALSPSREPKRMRLSQSPKAIKAHSSKDRKREPWQIQKSALTKKFGELEWTPRKRLSPDALEGIRALHAQYPDKYTTPALAEHFEVSPENIRRILKSKWRPNEEEDEDRRQRWERRGEFIWSNKAEMGLKPPTKWRVKGIGKDQVAFHKRRGHRFGRGMNEEESGLNSTTAGLENRGKPSLSDMIL